MKTNDDTRTRNSERLFCLAPAPKTGLVCGALFGLAGRCAGVHWLRRYVKTRIPINSKNIAMKPQQKSTRFENRPIVYDAAQRLFSENNRPFNRQQLVEQTGLPMAIVQEHLSSLIDDGLLTRIERGVYAVNKVLPTRAISITFLPDGDTKIEVGDDMMTLNPTEYKILASRLFPHPSAGVDPISQAAAARTEQMIRSMQASIANMYRHRSQQGDLLGDVA